MKLLSWERVLISTYWNVNQESYAEIVEKIEVLISTYWNVNKNLSINDLKRIHSFNLNLLECKCTFVKGDGIDVLAF